MYSIKYVGDNGKEFLFGEDNEIVFDANVGDGLTVNLNTTQGIFQVGESVQGQSIGGRIISFKGVIFKNIENKKKIIRNAFPPLSKGRLFFDDEYSIRVYVKESVSFSPIKGNGKFTVNFFAPIPYFSRGDSSNNYVGRIIPKFSFPVIYNKHKFGERDKNKVALIYNDGDVKVFYSAHLQFIGESINPIITNIQTTEFLKLNGTLQNGDTIDVYRDADSVLRAELTRNGKAIDIISWIDEKSNFFQLEIGDNIISIDDDEDGVGIIGRISFTPAVVSLYES